MPTDRQISIIVPIYNVEKYLSHCIESIICQTYANIQLILVNDGSKDASLQIARRYEAQDSRITVIDQPNGGVSKARNVGISHATGDYLAFVDSDDYVDPDYIATLAAPLQEHPYELICAAMVEFNTEYEYTVYSLPNGRWDLDTESGHVGLHMLYYTTSPVCKLYKRSIIKQHGLVFNETKDYAEDFEFNLNFIKHIHIVCSIDYVGYHYRKDISTSLSARQRDLTDVTKDRIKLWRLKRQDFISRGHDSDISRRYLTSDILSTLSDYIFYLSKSAGIGIYRQTIKRLDADDIYDYIEANKGLVRFDTFLSRLIASNHKLTAFILHKTLTAIKGK